MMTTADRIPAQRRRTPPAQANDYEWRGFIDGQAHCYRKRQLSSGWLYLLTPWCEEDQRFPLRHDRGSLSGQRVTPVLGRMCSGCCQRLYVATLEACSAQA